MWKLECTWYWWGENSTGVELTMKHVSESVHILWINKASVFPSFCDLPTAFLWIYDATEYKLQCYFTDHQERKNTSSKAMTYKHCK